MRSYTRSYTRSYRHLGFSLVELIAVLLIAGVLSVEAVANMPKINPELIQAKNQVITTLRYARQIALSRSQTATQIAVVTSATSIDLRENAVSLGLPDTQYPYQLPAGVRLISGSGLLYFDHLGNTTAATLELSNGEQRQQITISAAGYVY